MMVGVPTIVMMFASQQLRGVLIIKMRFCEKMNWDVADVSSEESHDEQPPAPAWTSRQATSGVGA
jgi:hypothetical protein